jgi:uncharacterized protein YbjT (DUF2867 family)
MHGHFNSATFPALMRQAQEAGQHGMQISLQAAERHDPSFADRAKTAMLAHLRAVGQASGEDLVDVAIAHGCRAPDARAFGGVFQSLSRQNVIRCIRSDLPRKRGHGTSGGKLWELAE